MFILEAGGVTSTIAKKTATTTASGTVTKTAAARPTTTATTKPARPASATTAGKLNGCLFVLAQLLKHFDHNRLNDDVFFSLFSFLATKTVSKVSSTAAPRVPLSARYVSIHIPY